MKNVKMKILIILLPLFMLSNLYAVSADIIVEESDNINGGFYKSYAISVTNESARIKVTISTTGGDINLLIIDLENYILYSNGFDYESNLEKNEIDSGSHETNVAKGSYYVILDNFNDGSVDYDIKIEILEPKSDDDKLFFYFGFELILGTVVAFWIIRKKTNKR